MGSAWAVAGSLDQLLAQLDTIAPWRSRASDGAIGDAAHASRSSDHNPWWTLAGQAYVTARDFTHDPAAGLDCARLAAALAAGRDQRVKYVIWDRQIMAGAAGPSPWTWRPYSGTNPHTKHLHLSVVADARALTRIPWTLPRTLSTPSPSPRPTEEDDMTPEQDRMLREVHAELFRRHPTRADYRLVGESEPGVRPSDTAAGFAINADARAYETRQLVQQLRAELASRPGLSVDEVRGLLREALADIGPLYLTPTPEGA